MRMFDWDAPISPERREALIDRLAQLVIRHGMAAPATLFLAAHKPLSYLGSQALLLASGALAPLMGPQNLQEMIKLLESPENVDFLIARIEDLHNGTRQLGREDTAAPHKRHHRGDDLRGTAT